MRIQRVLGSKVFRASDSGSSRLPVGSHKSWRIDNLVFDLSLSLHHSVGTLVHQDTYQQGHYQYETCLCKYRFPPTLVDYRIDYRQAWKGSGCRRASWTRTPVFVQRREEVTVPKPNRNQS